MRAALTRIKYVIVLLALLAAGAPAAPRVEESRPLMGTAVEIVAEGESEPRLRAAVGAAYDEMARLSDMMNHYDPKSVVSAINDAAGLRPVAVPPELLEVLEMAERLSERSAGAFDVTIGALRGWRFRRDAPRLPPATEVAAQRALVNYRSLRLDRGARSAFLSEPGMRIDLGGIAKAYILQAGLRVLERGGATRALLNAGGDVVAAGGGWRVGVRDPRAPQRLLGVIALERGAVLSSGDYERFFVRDGRRYHHILDPRTGYPSQGPHGVTLVAESVEAANGLGVTIMVLGKDAGQRLLAATPGVDALVVDRGGSVWMTEGFRARLVDGPRAQ